MRTLTFHSDPGHAWLEVPLAELKSLGVAGEISSYSYINGETAYLEEDCDAGIFIDKLMDDNVAVPFRVFPESF